MHRLILNSLVNLFIVIIAGTGAWHFVVDQYMGLPLWLSTTMALVAMGAVFYNVYVEFLRDYEVVRVERLRVKSGFGSDGSMGLGG
jgi:hypothetical protein